MRVRRRAPRRSGPDQDGRTARAWADRGTMTCHVTNTYGRLSHSSPSIDLHKPAEDCHRRASLQLQRGPVDSIVIEAALMLSVPLASIVVALSPDVSA
jgi:hypothetical protein